MRYRHTYHESVDIHVHPGNLCDKVMAECATVKEVLAIFDQYNLEFLKQGMLMFGDATANSVIIEGDRTINTVQSYFGLRKISLDTDNGASVCNNERLYFADQLQIAGRSCPSC